MMMVVVVEVVVEVMVMLWSKKGATKE
jgi:hypothetical protein